MGEERNHTEAKGLYTFTTVEKIQYRYAVVASSWAQAKKDMESGRNVLRLRAGDHAGGAYIGDSEPRRETLLRKEECIMSKLLMKQTNSRWIEVAGTDTVYWRPRHDNLLTYKANWDQEVDMDYSSRDDLDDYDNLAVHEIDPATGICNRCNQFLDYGWEIAHKAPIRNMVEVVYVAGNWQVKE
jgi:hypothetical protein